MILFAISSVTIAQQKVEFNQFKKQVSENPNNVKALSGLGECYYQLQKYDSAYFFFNKAQTLSPDDAMITILVAKSQFQLGKKDVAEILFAQALKQDKKSSKIPVTISKAYYEGKTKDLEKAAFYSTEAKKLNSRDAQAYLVAGDVLLLKEVYNEAAVQYEQSMYFDSTNYEPQIKLADIYILAHNYKLTKKFANNVLRLNPDFYQAYSRLGDANYELGKYEEAIKAYAEFLAKEPNNEDVQRKYAFSLFFNKNYDLAQTEIAKIAKGDSTNHVMMRLTSYINFEKGEFEKGAKLMEKFFATILPEKIITQDYEYMAKFQAELGKDSLAIVNYNIAYSRDTTKITSLPEIAKLQGKMKKYDKSVEIYELYMKKVSTPLNSDYFLLGKALYNAGNFTTDTILKKTYFEKADTTFGKVIELSTKSYLGYFWKGRVRSALDPETTLGLAKPQYEKTIEITASNTTKYKKELIESYSYLGYFYYVKNDATNSKLNWSKILEIDPTNEKALQAIKEIK